jgi:hypothetical protein
LLLAFARAAWYFKRRALRDLALPHPELLSSKEKRRLQHYFYGTTYLSIIFCSLRGRIRTRGEKHLFTNLAALAYFFDDLVDAFRNRDDSGILWEDNPEEYGRTADERGLALHFLHNIYAALPPADLEEFKKYMHCVFNIEAAGRQQQIQAATAAHVENCTEPETRKRDLSIRIDPDFPGSGAWAGPETGKAQSQADLGEIERITAEKGGYSVLLFRRVLRQNIPVEEQSALLEFGFLIQLCDDIFDIWFDHREGTVTLAVVWGRTGRVDLMADCFETQVERTIAAFRRMTYSRVQIETALRVAHYIVSITRVCLQHYVDLQTQYKNLPLDDRALMVVDMERWKNRLRAAVALLAPLH